MAGMQGVSCITTHFGFVSEDSHTRASHPLTARVRCTLPSLVQWRIPVAHQRPPTSTPGRGQQSGLQVICCSASSRRGVKISPLHRAVTKMGDLSAKDLSWARALPRHWHCGLVSPAQNKPLFAPKTCTVSLKEHARQLNSKKLCSRQADARNLGPRCLGTMRWVVYMCRGLDW